MANFIVQTHHVMCGSIDVFTACLRLQSGDFVHLIQQIAMKVGRDETGRRETDVVYVTQSMHAMYPPTDEE